jgi:hypothetical protein
MSAAIDRDHDSSRQDQVARKLGARFMVEVFAIAAFFGTHHDFKPLLWPDSDGTRGFSRVSKLRTESG